jgi:hypothetical protein
MMRRLLLMVSERCELHLDSTRWSRTPIPDRPGWELARCVDCGVFIGMNPIPNTKAAEKQAAIEAAAAKAKLEEFDWGDDDETP